MKYNRLQKNVVTSIMVLVIPLILTLVILFSFPLINGEVEGVIRNINVALFLLFMIIFVIYLAYVLIYYSRKYGIPDMNDYYGKIYGYSFAVFLIYYGLAEMIFYNHFNALYMTAIGIGAFIIEYRGVKMIHTLIGFLLIVAGMLFLFSYANYGLVLGLIAILIEAIRFALK